MPFPSEVIAKVDTSGGPQILDDAQPMEVVSRKFSENS